MAICPVKCVNLCRGREGDHTPPSALPHMNGHRSPPAPLPAHLPATGLTAAPLPSPLPQEEGNIPYVVDNGVGAFETRPPFIAETLQRWLGPDSKGALEGMAARSKALGRPEAVYKIVEDLAR